MKELEAVERLAECARQETGPRIAVAARVGRSLEEMEHMAASPLDRQLKVFAAVSVTLAGIVGVPAFNAWQTLFDPIATFLSQTTMVLP